MKKISLFGASGKTGQEFLKLALARGYAVKALVRNPGKIMQAHPNLEILQGDILHPAEVAGTVAGTDVVVSVFGHVKGSPEWLQTNGTLNIVEAMKKADVRKIVSLSGGGLPYVADKPKLPDKIIRTMMKLLVPKVLNDAIKHAQILQQSNLDWIIVRAPRLNTTPAKGSYRVGWVGVNASTQIGRADLADFILKQVEDESFIGKMPFVSY